VHCATYRTAGLIDTASNRQGGHPRRGRRAKLPPARNALVLRWWT
jgi:hypothetical protein